MNQRIVLFLIAFALAMAQGWAFDGMSVDVNPTQVHFATAVEQTTTKTVSFLFSLETSTSLDGEVSICVGDFTVSIEGADRSKFSAQITEKNIFQGTCKVLITYLPMSEGPHQAMLKVTKEGGGVSTKTVLLTGETSEENRDPLSTHSNGLFEKDEDHLTNPTISVVSGEGMNPRGGMRPGTGSSNTDAVIEVTPSSLDFGNTMVGYSAVKTFFVKGENLTGPLSLTVATTRSGASDGFSIDKTSISSYQAENGIFVTVTYKPTSVGTHNSTSICISGVGVESKTVSLNGTAVASALPITVDVASLSFPGVAVGDYETKEFTVTVPATNVTDLITLRPILNDATGMFSISPESFTAQEAVNGVKVRVKYKPTEAGSHSAKVSFFGRGIETKTINLTGATFAEYSTILVTSDDVTMECLIDQNSNIKIEKPYLVIRTHDQVLTYDLEKMTQVRYGQRVVVGDTGQGTLKAGSIILHGLKDNALIEVTASDGRVVMSNNGSDNGNITLSLDNEPSGEYKISTASQTIKIVKQ